MGLSYKDARAMVFKTAELNHENALVAEALAKEAKDGFKGTPANYQSMERAKKAVRVGVGVLIDCVQSQGWGEQEVLDFLYNRYQAAAYDLRNAKKEQPILGKDAFEDQQIAESSPSDNGK